MRGEDESKHPSRTWDLPAVTFGLGFILALPMGCALGAWFTGFGR